MFDLSDAETGLFLRFSTNSVQWRFIFYSARNRFHQSLAITEV